MEAGAKVFDLISVQPPACRCRRLSLVGVLSCGLLIGCGQQGLSAVDKEDAQATLNNAARALGQGMQKLKQTVGEAELSGKVYARLGWDKQLQACSVTIDSQPGGVVELRGTVPNDRLHARLIDIVANTMGVKEVIDRTEIGSVPESGSRANTATSTSRTVR